MESGESGRARKGEDHGRPEPIREKLQDPEGFNPRGLALTKNRQSWQIAI